MNNDTINNLTPDQWTIPRIVEIQAHTRPEELAIEFINSTSWTYNDCKSNALATAAELDAQGVSATDHVAVMIDDAELFCRYWLGLSFLGATMVAINTSMRGAVLTHQLNIASAKFIVTEDIHNKTIAGLALQITNIPARNDNTHAQCSSPEILAGKLPKQSPADTTCIMFTSGTSGPSKGVEMPHAHCVLFAIGTIENYQLSDSDCFYICLPLFHANGLFMQLLACLLCGCKAVIRNRFSATRWLDDIRRTNATHTNMLGAVASFIVAQKPTPHDQAHQLRVIGAAPLPASAESEFRNRFGVPQVLPLYGMTEVNIPLYGKLNESAPGTCGKLYKKYFEVEIRDPDHDTPLPQGTIGEIMVRPRHPFGFMSGYVGMPEKTLEAWRNFWFHTGDAAYINAKDQFVFVDRIKDCIRRRGENISSYEVEQAFLALDDIAEAAAYAVPADGGDGMEDEVMVALLLKENTGTYKFDQWCQDAAINLAKFAVPRYLRIMSDLPKTPTGKIRKVVLREEGITEDTFDTKKARN